MIKSYIIFYSYFYFHFFEGRERGEKVYQTLKPGLLTYSKIFQAISLRLYVERWRKS